MTFYQVSTARESIVVEAEQRSDVQAWMRTQGFPGAMVEETISLQEARERLAKSLGRLMPDVSEAAVRESAGCNDPAERVIKVPAAAGRTQERYSDNRADIRSSGIMRIRNEVTRQ